MTAKIEDFADDRFAAENGICYLEVGEGFARTTVTIESRHLNSLGIVHGGTLFTLAATALFAAANSRGRTAVGTNLNLSCLQAVSAGRLEARATERWSISGGGWSPHCRGPHTSKTRRFHRVKPPDSNSADGMVLATVLRWAQVVDAILRAH